MYNGISQKAQFLVKSQVSGAKAELQVLYDFTKSSQKSET